MRTVLAALVLLCPSEVFAEAPSCALPPPVRVASTSPVGVDRAPAPVPILPPAHRPLPEALSSLPFVLHVAAAGPLIVDLGFSHGLRAVAARRDNEFRLFQVAADGRSAVSGAITEIAPKQLATIAGDVTDLGVDHGFRGYFVRSGAQFQVFYETPDGKALIPGVLYDADGKDLTRGQVVNIPGAIPTVVVGDTPGTAAPGSPATSDIPAIAGVSALTLVQKAAAGTIGSTSAPHLWMLVDPQCIYSVRAYQSLRPYVDSGRVQLSVIPLSVLDYEDQGQSTKSALALLSKPTDQLVTAWQAGDVAGKPVPEASSRLAVNMAVSQAIALHGTPTFVWRKPDGTEGRLDGMPTSVDALVSSIGG